MKIQSQLLAKARAVHKRTHIDQRAIWKIKEAASITREKVDEICRLIPGFKNEIKWERGQSKASNKDVEYKFKNRSVLDIMAARQSSRGSRYTFGLIEECVLVDETALNEIIIPTMNVNRRLPDGSRHPEEITNKSQIYINFFGQKFTKICA